MKKFLTTLLTVVLTATLAIGGTMAYLTKDAGDENNVFSVGDIDVSLDEKVGVFGEGGKVNKKEDGAEYTEIMPGDYLQKEVTVTNNGEKDAYVAVTVTLNNALEINKAIDEYYEKLKYSPEKIQEMYNEIFDGWGINYNPRPGADGVDDARGVIDGKYPLPEHVLKVDFAKTTKGSTLIGATNWFIAEKETAGQYWVDGPAEYNGYYTKNMEDYEICYTYYLYLPAGESSTLFNGLNVPAEFDADQLAMFDGLEINVEAKAIQADNMGTAVIYKDDANGKAKTAFAVLAGDISADSLEVNNKPNTVKVEGNDKTAVVAAINAAEPGDIVMLTKNTKIAGYGANDKLTIDKAIVLDLNGYTLTTECGWGGIDAKGGCSIKNGTINHTGNTAAIKAFQVESIENVTINVTETEGKIKGGIVVQEGADCYVGTIKNVTITGATNGIETYKCGQRDDLAIGSMENVTVNATEAGIKLSAPIGQVTNCDIKGTSIGVEMYLYGPYSVSMELINSTVSGETAIYAHDELEKTNPGSLTLTYDDDTVINGNIVKEFESEVAERVKIN